MRSFGQAEPLFISHQRILVSILVCTHDIGLRPLRPEPSSKFSKKNCRALLTKSIFLLKLVYKHTEALKNPIRGDFLNQNLATDYFPGKGQRQSQKPLDIDCLREYDAATYTCSAFTKNSNFCKKPEQEAKRRQIRVLSKKSQSRHFFASVRYFRLGSSHLSVMRHSPAR